MTATLLGTIWFTVNPGPKTGLALASVSTLAAQPSAAELDRRYLAELTSSGVVITDVVVAVQSGHNVCASPSAGRPRAAIEADGLSENPTWPWLVAHTMVVSAIDVYCPQYAG